MACSSESTTDASSSKCAQTIEQACAQATAGSALGSACKIDVAHASGASAWPLPCANALAPRSGRLLKSAPGAGLTSFSDSGTDTSTDYYFDDGTGKLVAVVDTASSPSAISKCIAGPSTFNAPAKVPAVGNICCPEATADAHFVCSKPLDAGAD